MYATAILNVNAGSVNGKGDYYTATLWPITPGSAIGHHNNQKESQCLLRALCEIPTILSHCRNRSDTPTNQDGTNRYHRRDHVEHTDAIKL